MRDAPSVKEVCILYALNTDPQALMFLAIPQTAEVLSLGIYAMNDLVSASPMVSPLLCER